MDRAILKDIERWNQDTRRKPLVLMGARQVGKTWLLNAFAQKHYPNQCVQVDLQRDERLRQGIEDSDIDPKTLIDLIQASTGQEVIPGKTLLVIDEIQESHKALNSLKYFNQDMPELAVAVAGSLLGLALGNSSDQRKRPERGSFPVGKVNFLFVPPMTFTEFVQAADNPMRFKALNDLDWKLLSLQHTHFEDLLRRYLFVGGMPEAVETFARTGNYAAVRKVHKEILLSYDTDFVKHAPPELLAKIRLLWNNIPAQLAKENKKFVYTALKSGARAREYETALQWLDDAGMIKQVYRISEPLLPVKAHRDFSAFKLYMHDVGLLGAMSGLTSQALLLKDEIFANFKGALGEQFALQEMIAQGKEPVYWTSGSGNAEVEFALQAADGVIPVEVKSGYNAKAKSLGEYLRRFNPRLALRTSLNEYSCGPTITDLPLYAFGSYLRTVSTGEV